MGEQWVEVAPGVQARSGASGLPVAEGRPAGPGPGIGPGTEKAGRRTRNGGARHRIRGIPMLIAVVALVVVIGGMGVSAGLPGRATVPGQGGPSGGPTQSPKAVATTRPSIDAVDWWAVLAVLDERRADALRQGDPAALGAYAVPGSPAWEVDADLLSRLGVAGLRPEGLRTQLIAIEQAGGCDGSACVVLVDRRGPYALVDAQGAAVEQVPAADSQRWRLTLDPVAVVDASDPGWRLREVEPIR